MPLPLQILCIILLSIASLILFVLSLKGTLIVEYDEELKIFFKLLFVKQQLFPLKQKKVRKIRYMSRRRAANIRKRAEIKAEKQRQKLKEKKKKKTEKNKAPANKHKKITLETVGDILDLLKVITELSADLVKRFTNRLHIRVDRLKIKVASPDAATTAVAYGATTQIINILLPILYEVNNLKLPKRKQDLGVIADFESFTPDVRLKLSFALRTWHLLDISLPTLIKAIPYIPEYIEKFFRSKSENTPTQNNEEKSNSFFDIEQLKKFK